MKKSALSFYRFGLATPKRWSLAILAGLLVFQIVTHLAWLSISAHSGQVAIPWMMNRGKVLFDDLLEQHAPGSSILAAAIQRVFPLEPVADIRLANLLLVLGVTVLVYGLAYSLSDRSPMTAIAAVLVWMVWEPVYGNIMLYFDSLVGLTLLLAVAAWFVTEERAPGWLAPLLAGFLFGCATLFKQHAWSAVFLFALWRAVLRPRSNLWRDLVILGLSALAAVGSVVGVFALQGNLDTYLYWNWEFNLSGIMPGVAWSGDFVRKLLLTNSLMPAFWLLTIRQTSRRPEWVLIGLVWLAGTTTLVPRPGESHVMAHLPALAVASGLVIGQVFGEFLTAFDRRRPWRWLTQAAPAELTLVGVGVALMAGWAWTGAAAYGSSPFGRAGIPAYDEFKPVVARLDRFCPPDGTLFVLPETDSTPQLHLLSDMLPPGTWIKGWYWYLRAPGIVTRLLDEWSAKPPDCMVVFPELAAEARPYIDPLLDFVDQHYEQAGTAIPVLYHGEAQTYRLR